MTAKTPHGLAFDDYLLNKGPTPRDQLLQYVAKFVPVGLAVLSDRSTRASRRRRSGHALDVPIDQVAPGYESKAADPTARGSRQMALHVLHNRLRNGTAFINDDGLIQHRDWKP